MAVERQRTCRAVLRSVILSVSTVNQCQCQSEFVNVAKIAKLFRSSRERKTVGRQTIRAVTQEKTSVRGMSLDVDGIQAEKGFFLLIGNTM